MQVIYAPDNQKIDSDKITIFLGGSIDMGSAEDWQQKTIDVFSGPKWNDVVFLNPRRKDWDSSWKQHPSNPDFYEQVTWEMDKQNDAFINVYYFADDSKSPITLLELGRYANSTTVVYCSDKFYRYGNVEIFCTREGVSHAETFEDFIFLLEKKINFASRIREGFKSLRSHIQKL